MYRKYTERIVNSSDIWGRLLDVGWEFFLFMYSLLDYLTNFPYILLYLKLAIKVHI